MFGMALTEIRKGKGKENVEKALEPFLAFVGGEWESIDDESCYNCILEIFKLSDEEQKGSLLSYLLLLVLYYYTFFSNFRFRFIACNVQEYEWNNSEEYIQDSPRF